MQLTIKEMQKMELEMLKELHKFMTKNKLRYYLIGGSMLGAMRHKGFIPWDDDIDIGMPRKDFEKLLLLAEELPKPLALKFFRNTDQYIYNFSKVENTNTLLIESDIKHLNIQSGVYIDVFPLDGVPEGNVLRKIHLGRIKLLFILRGLCCADREKKRNPIKQMMVVLMQNLCLLRSVLGKLDSLMKKYDFDECATIANYSGAWGEREVMPKWYMGKPSLCIFENDKFFGVEKPHEYLRNVYGDYMELPPEEKRCSHHKFKVEIIDNERDII